MSDPPPHIRLCPAIDSARSLPFPPIDRDVPEGVVLKLGRFAERRDTPVYCITFRSKVVSRSHAEIWFKDDGFYLKDCKSSSGTFLNNVRLSPANVESRPYPLKDGDVIQLGLEYQGGSEDVHKCIRIKVEINRSTLLKKAKQFRTQTAKTIKALTSGEADKTTKSECCICLSKMGPLQALFISPCGHPFHYKCIKPMLANSDVYFVCPLCRHYADLEASLSMEDLSDWLDEEEADGRKPEVKSNATETSGRGVAAMPRLKTLSLMDMNGSTPTDDSLPHNLASTSGEEAMHGNPLARRGFLLGEEGEGGSSDMPMDGQMVDGVHHLSAESLDPSSRSPDETPRKKGSQGELSVVPVYP